MKKVKLFLHSLLVILVMSCQVNDEMYELENESLVNSESFISGGGFEYEDPDNPPTDPFTRTKIAITYESGTTEFQKNQIRNSIGIDLGLFTWSQCTNNPNIEIWTIRHIAYPDFPPTQDKLENEDPITQARHEDIFINSGCN